MEWPIAIIGSYRLLGFTGKFESPSGEWPDAVGTMKSDSISAFVS
jgi:hypothetical protein